VRNILKVDKISVCINDKSIIKNISFEIFEHEILMIIGPNGAGKTTLIKAIMQNAKHSGAAYLNGKNIANISAKEIAKQIGVLTQKHSQQFSFTVYEVVSLGRYAHKTGMFSRMNKEDLEKIDNALRLTGTYRLKDRSVLTLSGGELQRIFLASVFAQDPKILILDEPTNHLDLQYQIGIFDTLKEWVKGEGRSVIAVVHDLNVVYTYGTKALLMNEGLVYAYGNVEEVLNRENLKKVYEVDVALWMQNLLKHWR
jgi:iron complex transport system ATP-binding protein